MAKTKGCVGRVLWSCGFADQALTFCFHCSFSLLLRWMMEVSVDFVITISFNTCFNICFNTCFLTFLLFRIMFLTVHLQ
jgi:hypothetical protein